MRFKFQLKGLLRHRKSIEQDRMRELSMVQANMHYLQAELKQIEQMMTEATRDLRENRLVGRIDMGYLAAHRRFTFSMQRKTLGVAQRMALVQRQLDEARAALAEAAKQRKIVEKLREKQYERWVADRDYRERMEQDEIGMQLDYRRRAEAAAEFSLEAPVESTTERSSL